MVQQVIRWRADDGSLHESEQAAAVHDHQLLLAAWLEGHPHLKWASSSQPTTVASVMLADPKFPFVLTAKPGIRDAAAVAEGPPVSATGLKPA